MVKAVTSTYITQENRKQGARFVYAVTYQKTAATKATIPSGEIIEAPVISNAIGRDFLALSGGDVQLVLSNRQRQWDDTYSGAYNRSKYDGDLRVYAGFALPSGGQELLELFSGKITNIEMSGVAPRNAVVTARNVINNKISNYILGKPALGGTPFPYIYGLRVREKMYNLNAASPKLYHYLYQGSILDIPAVWKRRDNTQLWDQVPIGDITVNTVKKTITFNNPSTPGNQVAANIEFTNRYPATHVVYVFKDILQNYISIPSTHINSTYLERVRAIEPSSSGAGIKFEDITGLEAILKLSHFLYAAAYIDGKKINIVSLGSPPSSGVSLGESDYKTLFLSIDTTRIINRTDIPYGGYKLTAPQSNALKQIIQKSNSTSQASFGTMMLQSYYDDFSFTTEDPIQILINATQTLKRNISSIVKNNAHAKRIFSLSNVYSKALRLELGDRVRLSNAFFGLNQASAVVISKTVDLNRKRTDLLLLSWP